MSQIGDRIREARLESGLTQNALAMAAGVDCTAISRWEQNRKVPSTQALVKLATALSVSADYLLGIESTTTEE